MNRLNDKVAYVVAGVDAASFQWIEPPAPDTLQLAKSDLVYQGAIDDNSQLTELGRLIVELQVRDPGFVRPVLLSDMLLDGWDCYHYSFYLLRYQFSPSPNAL
jgi:HrpA-like RNA helicase